MSMSQQYKHSLFSPFGRRDIFFFSFLNFYWSIVDLQCCVSFRHTSKVNQLYIHISILFKILFPYRQWHPTPVLLPGKSHGWRSLVGCSLWGRQESDTTEWLHFHFSLSCTGEGNGNPLQRFCLENPRDGGAWWAAIYGVTQSRTRLKWLSSSIAHYRVLSRFLVLYSRAFLVIYFIHVRVCWVFSCPTLCDTIDCSPPGSFVYGILQARKLERVAMSSCRGSSWPRNQARASYVSCTGRWVLSHQCHLGSFQEPNHVSPRSNGLIFASSGSAVMVQNTTTTNDEKWL